MSRHIRVLATSAHFIPTVDVRRESDAHYPASKTTPTVASWAAMRQEW